MSNTSELAADLLQRLKAESTEANSAKNAAWGRVCDLERQLEKANDAYKAACDASDRASAALSHCTTLSKLVSA